MKTKPATDGPKPLWRQLYRPTLSTPDNHPRLSVSPLFPTPPDSPLPSAEPPPAPTALPRKSGRNGKIARLPYLARDMVNRMLRNNIPYSQIVAALALHKILVTARNVSNWKTHGGFQEWCREQDRALEAPLLQDNLIEFLPRNSDLPMTPDT